MKKCCKCKEEKNYDCFYKDAKAKDGYNFICKVCRLCMDRERRKKDSQWVERRKKQNSEYHKKNREEISERKKTWFQTENGKQSHFQSAKKYRQKYPEKRKAHDTVYNALQKGELVRPQHCQICNEKGRIEAHHASYDKNRRSSIIWICKLCHENITRNFKNGSN